MADTNTLWLAAKEFVERAGATAPEKHAEYIVKVAQAFVDVKNPKKARKVLIALEYDNVLMASLEVIVRTHFGLKTSVSSFTQFWRSLSALLVRLQIEDQKSFHQVVKAIIERPVEMKREWIKRSNVFEEIKEELQIYSPSVDSFLRKVYELNVQIGSNPSGKGEHIFLLFYRDCERASDILIRDIEYEIKTSGACVGTSVGSSFEFKETFTRLFPEEKFREVSFGQVRFRKKWAPIFVEFSKSFPQEAVKILEFQQKFYAFADHVQVAMYERAVDNFFTSPSVDSLAEVYNTLGVQYVKHALKGKDMIVFDEEPTGEYWVFSPKVTELAMSFAGTEHNTPLKLNFPKSSATMRPEITKHKQFSHEEFTLDKREP